MHAVMDVPSTKTISNPYRHESFPIASGARADVFFYYTETIESDGAISEEELTPVWFVDDGLVGWGRSGFDLWRVNAQNASAER